MHQWKTKHRKTAGKFVTYFHICIFKNLECESFVIIEHTLYQLIRWLNLCKPENSKGLTTKISKVCNAPTYYRCHLLSQIRGWKFGTISRGARYINCYVFIVKHYGRWMKQLKSTKRKLTTQTRIKQEILETVSVTSSFKEIEWKSLEEKSKTPDHNRKFKQKRTPWVETRPYSHIIRQERTSSNWTGGIGSAVAMWDKVQTWPRDIGTLHRPVLCL